MSVFTQAGGGATQLDGYEIDNSLMFNDPDSASLNRTPSSAGNRRTFTFSTWVKKCDPQTGGNQRLISGANGSGNLFTTIEFDSGDAVRLLAGTESGSATVSIETSAVLRDPSAWYNIVCAVDSTQASSGDRLKIYVNGVLQTLSTSIAVPLNKDFEINQTVPQRIGATDATSSPPASFLHGYLADTILVDGQLLDASSFGKTNTNGVWIPINYGGSFGTNGFKLEYQKTGTSQNANGIGADTSGNGNHFAVNNFEATDIGTDTPTNSFATLNPLTARSYPVLRQGNLQQYDHSTGNSGCVASTIMPISGKWYCEMLLESPSPGDYPFFGITDTLNLNQQGDQGSKMAAGFEIDGATNNQSTTNLGTITNTNTGWPTFADNDIVMFALDCDNRKWWLGRNGTWINSGDPAAGTGQQLSWTNDTEVCSVMMGYSGGGGGGDGSIWNFGNPHAITISSGNADADGHGNFEYSVPSGYFALCSKNLAEYG